MEYINRGTVALIVSSVVLFTYQFTSFFSTWLAALACILLFSAGLATLFISIVIRFVPAHIINSFLMHIITKSATEATKASTADTAKASTADAAVTPNTAKASTVDTAVPPDTSKASTTDTQTVNAIAKSQRVFQTFLRILMEKDDLRERCNKSTSPLLSEETLARIKKLFEGPGRRSKRGNPDLDIDEDCDICQLCERCNKSESTTSPVTPEEKSAIMEDSNDDHKGMPGIDGRTGIPKSLPPELSLKAECVAGPPGIKAEGVTSDTVNIVSTNKSESTTPPPITPEEKSSRTKKLLRGSALERILNKLPVEERVKIFKLLSSSPLLDTILCSSTPETVGMM